MPETPRETFTVCIVRVMAYIVMTYIVMTYMFIGSIVIAYIVIAYIYNYGPYSYGVSRLSRAYHGCGAAEPLFIQSEAAELVDNAALFPGGVCAVRPAEGGLLESATDYGQGWFKWPAVPS